MEVSATYRESFAAQRARLARAAPLVGVLVLAAALDLLRAANLSIWRDEAFSLILARAPWSEVARVIAETQANMALYYVLLKVWLTLGDGEAYVRSFSAVAAVGAVAATYAFAARLFGRTVGIVAALLLSVNALLVEYAQEARGYALATFLVALGCFFYVATIDDRRRIYPLAFAVTMGLAVYAHLFAGFVLLAHALTLAVVPRHIRTRVAGAVAGAAVVGAPVVITAVARDAGQVAWIDEPTLTSLAYLSRALAGDTWTLLVIYAALGVLGIAAAARADALWKPVLVASSAALPVVVPLALSYAKPILVDRYTIVALPGIVTLVALGIVRLRRPVLVGVALAALVAASAQGLANYYRYAQKEEFRPAAAYVLEHTSPGDGIIFYRSTRRVPFEYYVRRHDGPLPDPLYPAAAWGDFDLVSDYRSERPRMTLLAEQVSRRRTVWLVVCACRQRTVARERTLADLIALVEQGHAVAERRRYYGVEVRRYEQR